jgi:hypothetical protein
MAPQSQKGPRAERPDRLAARCDQGASISTPGGTRTPNLLIRSQTLYPIELRAQGLCSLAGVAGEDQLKCDPSSASECSRPRCRAIPADRRRGRWALDGRGHRRNRKPSAKRPNALLWTLMDAAWQSTDQEVGGSSRPGRAGRAVRAILESHQSHVRSKLHHNLPTLGLEGRGPEAECAVATGTAGLGNNGPGFPLQLLGEFSNTSPLSRRNLSVSHSPARSTSDSVVVAPAKVMVSSCGDVVAVVPSGDAEVQPNTRPQDRHDEPSSLPRHQAVSLRYDLVPSSAQTRMTLANNTQMRKAARSARG